MTQPIPKRPAGYKPSDHEELEELRDFAEEFADLIHIWHPDRDPLDVGEGAAAFAHSIGITHSLSLAFGVRARCHYQDRQEHRDDE